MNVTYTCSQCERTHRAELAAGTQELVCAGCGQRLQIPAGAIEGGRLTRCVVCPSKDLFVRKDFPQQIGVTVVVLGLAASCVAWFFYRTYLTFEILFATALTDFLLYLVVGNSLRCYRCEAEYRQLEGIDEHAAFDLEVHERYRQEKARLDQQRAAARETHDRVGS